MASRLGRLMWRPSDTAVARVGDHLTSDVVRCGGFTAVARAEAHYIAGR